MKTVTLFFFFFILTITSIKAQVINNCPKEHNSDMCIGYLGTFYATPSASETTPNIFVMTIPTGYSVLAVAGPYAYFNWKIEGQKLTIYWNTYEGGSRAVWPEIALGNGSHFLHIQIIY